MGEKLAPKNENSGQISLIAGTLILYFIRMWKMGIRRLVWLEVIKNEKKLKSVVISFLIITKSKNSNDYSKVTEDNK